MYLSNWIKSNIVYVNELLNEKGELCAEYIKDKLMKNYNRLAEMYLLKMAEPKEWLTVLANNTRTNKTSFERKVYINDAFGSLENN